MENTSCLHSCHFVKDRICSKLDEGLLEGDSRSLIVLTVSVHEASALCLNLREPCVSHGHLNSPVRVYEPAAFRSCYQVNRDIIHFNHPVLHVDPGGIAKGLDVLNGGHARVHPQASLNLELSILDVGSDRWIISDIVAIREHRLHVRQFSLQVGHANLLHRSRFLNLYVL